MIFLLETDLPGSNAGAVGDPLICPSLVTPNPAGGWGNPRATISV